MDEIKENIKELAETVYLKMINKIDPKLSNSNKIFTSLVSIAKMFLNEKD